MHNLTGDWRGLYSYPTARDPVAFTAQLRHADAWLSGTTAEQVSEAAAGGVMAATISGKVGGGHVTFLKTYHRQAGGYDAVHYAGQVDAEGQEIWGTWTVPGNWSGTFLMIRAAQPQVALAERWAERV